MGGVKQQARLGWLPAEVTTFVGRRGEVAEVKRLLSAARLLTLTGVGGSGKSRLGLRVAIELRRAYTDGVWYVDLSALSDPSLLGHAIAEALGIPDRSDRPPADVLVDYLRDRQLLLVLDGCEAVLDDCAMVVANALREAPELRILCTSRQRLGILGEHLWTVAPLAVPDPEQPLPAGAASRYPGLSLFLERARAAAADFTMTTDNQAAVLRVCASLDGLPLAIELAAAQLRMLTVEQVAAGLDDRFRLLAARYASPARHRTLEATFDWSFALCSPAEQELWTRLSVFAGTFDAASVDAVCGSGECLPALVDKSVLVREDGRYQLLDTVREYGLGRLRALGDGAEAELRRHHGDHYLAVARKAEHDWFSPRQEQTFRDMLREQPNLRSALEHGLSTPGGAEAALDLAGTLWFLWSACGSLAEGRHWLERALAADGAPGRIRTKALWAAAGVAVAQGDRRHAEELMGEGLAQARGAGDDLAIAYALQVLGTVALWDDDLPGAGDLFANADERYTVLGELNGNVLMNRAQLAMVLASQGELDRAAALCEDVRKACTARGERWALAWALHVLAVVSAARGDIETATEHARYCLRTHHVFNNVTGMAMIMELLAGLALAKDATVRVATLHGVADQLWAALGQPRFGSSPTMEAQHAGCEQHTRRLLGDDGYDSAFSHGRELPLDDAVAYGLGVESDLPAVELDTVPYATLTPREREVAELVSRGLSNKEIAAELVTSQRTAETHVQNILRKLGFTSRAQIASWAGE